MDRSKKLDKQTLYEIYRACRLCGAGAGYKMPIIQNLVKVDGEEIELRQKIRECLQLEVNSNDKMPPLICESCVDKLDDFYEFLSTCRQTNTNTRKRLGLPLQDTPTPTKVIPAPVKVTPASAKVTPVTKKVVSKDIGTETCMLGLIEASAVKQDIYIVSKPPEIKKAKRNRNKKEEIQKESTVKPENSPISKDIGQNKEKDNARKKEPSPKRNTRQRNSLDELIMTRVQKLPKNQHVSRPGPKSRKIETKDEPPPPLPTRAKEKEDPPTKPIKKDDDLRSKSKRDRDDEPLNKLKRVREKDLKSDLTPPPIKKTKTSEPPKSLHPTKPQKSSKPSPKSVQTATTLSKNVQPEGVPCLVCSAVLKNSAGFKNHMHYAHPVTWTPDNLACNACRDWFSTIEESVSHHKKHTNYKCLRCKKKFKNGVLYHQHVENKRCLPDLEIPDVKCDNCLNTFPTNNLLKEHQCTGHDGRQGGKCSKCNRKFTLLKNLTKHESICMIGKKVVVERQPSIDPDVKRMLLPMEVRITKCDDLLQYGPVVSACTVPHRFGLDRKMLYPYMPKLRVIKKPTFYPMESLQDENKDEFDMDDLNWGDFEDIEIKTVKKLSTMCLKVIFSSKMLGELEILDEIEIARRLALKKRIDSIIFKLDDASSTHSDSILDKNAVATTLEVVDKNHHSDSTIFDETPAAGEEERGSDAKNDDFDRDSVDNHDNYVNLGTDNRIDNNTLISNVLSKTDVDINKTCDTNILNVKESSDGLLELSKPLRDDTTNHLSINLSTVSENILENNELEINKSKMVKNPTDTVNEIDISLKENNNFDNISSCIESSSVINTDNSTNDNNPIIVTENHDKLTKKDDDSNSSEETDTKSSAITTKNTVLSCNTFQNNGNNVAETRIDGIKSQTDSLNTCDGLKDDVERNNDSESNNYAKPIEEPHDSVIEANDSSTNHEKCSINNDILSRNENHTTSMEIDANTDNLDDNSISNEHTSKNPQNVYHHDDGQNTEVENMDIDETCSKNSLNLENTTKISENSDTESIGNVSHTKIDIHNDKSEDSCTKIIKSSQTNPNNDALQNTTETETTSPQKANKSLDFSVTGILNHVTSKNMDIDSKNIAFNIEKDKNTISNTETIENDEAINIKQAENETKNDKINDDNQSLDNLSLNDDNSNAKSDFDVKNVKHNDSISQNSISIFTNTLKEQTDDTLSLNSLKYSVKNSEVNKSDKFNVNDLSEDERKLMAELDEQIGETNDKIDKLNDGRDLNLDTFDDGYNFD